MGFDDLSGYCETGTLGCTNVLAVRTEELLEYKLKILRRYAHTGIRNFYNANGAGSWRTEI